MRVLPASFRRLLALVMLVVGAAPAVAQIVDIPPFTAIESSSSTHFGSYRFAPGADSSVVVVAGTWTSHGGKQIMVAQRVSAAGSATGGVINLSGETWTSARDVFADTRGGYIALWERSIGNALFGRLLDESGTPSTEPFLIEYGSPYQPQAAGLPSGFVVVWGDSLGLQIRLFDVLGQPRSPTPAPIALPPGSLSWLAVAGLADGGFVLVWQEGAEIRGQIFDGSGTPVGSVIEMGDRFNLRDVAASPLGGFAIVGTRSSLFSHAHRSGIWARRFDAAGSATGPAFVVDLLDPYYVVYPQAAFDPTGHLYVVWRPIAGLVPPLGRAYDPAGRPLNASFRLLDEFDFVSALILTVRPDGRFVEGWREGADMRMQVRSLCVPPAHTGCGNGVLEAPCEKCDAGPANSDVTPGACRTTCALPECGDGVADLFEQCDDGNLIGCDGCDPDCNLEPGYVCGDGTVFPECKEQCDDGPGNDDTLPNACRTDCQAAHCGDGVLDDGESCDDGNRTSCDGCSDLCAPEPGLVCGDGIPELLCGEECDDGNAIVGDGCTAPCRLERIPGGGSPATDCQAEWVVDNPANEPLYDKHGAISGVQTCTDGDPRCDFDGVAGQCTFRLRVCANNTDLPSCTPGTRLQSWELRAPSVSKAAKRPALAAVRAAFAPVPGAIIGPDQPDVCSGTLAVPVEVKTSAGGTKPGLLSLKSFASLYTGEKDSDKLRLVCRP